MITPMYFLHKYNNNEIFVKREDLFPKLLGGNKARISYEYMEDMISKHCDCMVGYGNARSNLCRALAFACKEAGFPCHIISPSDNDGQRISTYNYRFSQKAGAVFHYCTKKDVSETVDSVLSNLRSRGMNPYYIYGSRYGTGNESVPVRAYAAVYSEIKKQAKVNNVTFDYIFLATGVGMTQAGLLSGRTISNGAEIIIGISVARSSSVAVDVISKYCDSYSLSIDSPLVSKKDIIVIDDYVGSGYGIADADVKQCIAKMFVNYAFPLDETYTGKAFWGMLQYLSENNITGKRVLFIHTGGTPLFYDYANNL